MIALEVADLVVIASRTLSLDTGLVLDLLDPVAAERALDRARPGGEPGDPAGRAAALLHALLRERPLRRGNQQVALTATLQFLALNGWDVDPDPQIAGLVAGLAAGTLDTAAAAGPAAAAKAGRVGRGRPRHRRGPARPGTAAGRGQATAGTPVDRRRGRPGGHRGQPAAAPRA
jgi:hypothetical protein